MRSVLLSTLFLTLLLTAPARGDEPAGAGRSAEAGEAGATPELPPPEAPEDEYERGTPQSAMQGYLLAARRDDFERAAQYLDLRRLSREEGEQRGPELARELKIVLDQTLWVDLEALSQDPRGNLDDGLPSYRELVGAVEGPRGSIPIYLQRGSREDGVGVWKIAWATVERIPELYAIHGYTPLEERLPSWMLEPIAFEISLWIACALLGLAILAAAGSWLVVGGVALLSRPIFSRTRTDVDDRLVQATANPLRLAAGVALFRSGRQLLTLPLPVSEFLRGAEALLWFAAVAWFGMRLVDVFTIVAVRGLQRRGVTTALAAVPLGQKTAKGVVLALAGIALLDNFDFDVTALVAGLGIGGIAIALAAQKSMENLFGGVSVLADQPVAVGDFCRFGNRVGTVEEIGLRSARIRTLERTLVTIPNAEFAAMQIENFSARERIWYHPTLGLRYETTPEQLRYVLVEIRRMLYAHPKVDPDPARIRFTGFGAYSLDLEVFAYVQTRDFGEFLEIAEDLNLRIMDIVAESGSGFAFPSQTLYLGRDEGLDEKRSQQAAEKVDAWRERGELFLPRFPAERIRELAGTLDWPPAGSPRR